MRPGILSTGQTSRGTDFVLVVDSQGVTHGYYHTATGIANGTQVTAGQRIGTSNLSGRATGLHLHYTVQTGATRATRVDPLPFLRNLNPSTPGQ